MLGVVTFNEVCLYLLNARVALFSNIIVGSSMIANPHESQICLVIVS